MWRFSFVCFERVNADGLRAHGALAEVHSNNIHEYIYLKTRPFLRNVGDDDLENLYIWLFVYVWSFKRKSTTAIFFGDHEIYDFYILRVPSVQVRKAAWRYTRKMRVCLKYDLDALLTYVSYSMYVVCTVRSMYKCTRSKALPCVKYVKRDREYTCMYTPYSKYTEHGASLECLCWSSE